MTWQILYQKFRVYHPYAGYRRQIIEQLLYSYWEDGPKLPLFISSIWFDIVRLVSKTDAEREEIFKPNDWVQDFIKASQPGISHHFDSAYFERAREEFDQNPGAFVRCLEEYSHNLRVRDLAESILVYCSDSKEDPSERQDRLKCWLTLDAKIREIFSSSTGSATTIASYTFPNPDDIRNTIHQLKTANGLQDSGDNLIRFLNGCISNYMPQEDTG